MISRNVSNSSDEENISVLIQEILGDSHINYESLFFLTIIYSIFLVIGVFGNLSTCIVILTNEYMRTATNVYLFNLAIADISTLVISKNISTLVISKNISTLVISKNIFTLGISKNISTQVICKN